MTKSDRLFKILFAVMVAFLPLVIFAEVWFPEKKWLLSIFVIAVLIARICLEIFKNKLSKEQRIFCSIGSFAVLTILLILFATMNVVNVVFCVFLIIFVALENFFLAFYFGKQMPELIDAIDYCFMIFDCSAILAFSFALFNELTLNIALFAILLTCIASVGYKIYYWAKVNDIISKIKGWFVRK